MTAAQDYQLLNKTTAAKTESRGFNLDSLTNQGIENLFASYDQVQVKNGAESVLLQRATAGPQGQTVNPRTDINQLGALQVLPDVGAAQTNFQVAQRQAAVTAQQATPTWEKYAVPAGIGLVVLASLFLVFRHG